MFAAKMAEADGSLSSPDSSSGSQSSLDPSGGTVCESFSNLKVLQPNNQIRELQTIIRNSTTTRSDFVFYSDRLIRLMVEEGLNCLPSYTCKVTTPTGCEYEGEWFEKMNCAVSILRNGEAMEKGLRDCCRSIRIGKILIRREQESRKPKVYYAKFPPQIEKRKVLLLYPTLETGATARVALKVLHEHKVPQKNIVLVTLFCTPHAARNILSEFPDITMLTSEVHSSCPTHFGNKYFGSD